MRKALVVTGKVGFNMTKQDLIEALKGLKSHKHSKIMQNYLESYLAEISKHKNIEDCFNNKTANTWQSWLLFERPEFSGYVKDWSIFDGDTTACILGQQPQLISFFKNLKHLEKNNYELLIKLQPSFINENFLSLL